MSRRINPGVMSRVKKDSLRVYPAGALERVLVVQKRSKRKKTARSYAALRRAAHYPLSLPPYCKAFMAFLGVHGHNAPLVRDSRQRSVCGSSATANWSIDYERSLSPKRLPEAQF